MDLSLYHNHWICEHGKTLRRALEQNRRERRAEGTSHLVFSIGISRLQGIQVHLHFHIYILVPLHHAATYHTHIQQEFGGNPKIIMLSSNPFWLMNAGAVAEISSPGNVDGK